METENESNNAPSPHQKHGKISFKMFILVTSFALTYFLAYDAPITQLPMIVQVLPEGWAFPSYLKVVLSALGNIGCVVYFLLTKIIKRRPRLDYFIYGLITAAFLCLVLLSFFWAETVEIGSNEHSVAFLVISFVIACLVSLNMLTYLPFMARFKKEYLIVFNFGQGFSTTLNSLLALAQGIGHKEEICASNHTHFNSSTVKTVSNFSTSVTYGRGDLNGNDSSIINARFTVSTFLLIVAAFQALGLLSFVGLNKMKLCKKELVTPVAAENDIDTEKTILKKRVILLLILRCWSTFVFGIMHPLLPYASLPYGVEIFYYANAISLAMMPVSNIVYWFFPTKSLVTITVTFGVLTSVNVYITLIATMSPCPILMNSAIGGSLIVRNHLFLP